MMTLGHNRRKSTIDGETVKSKSLPKVGKSRSLLRSATTLRDIGTPCDNQVQESRSV